MITSDLNSSSEKESFWCRFRNNFLYGLILILPAVATGWLILFVIRLISGPLSGLLNQHVPLGVSFVLSVLVITLLGFFARHFVGSTIIHFLESLLYRIPVVSSIYKSTKHIVSSFSTKNKSLLSAVLVEYPRKDMWALGFITSESVTGLKDKDGNELGQDKISIFVPTTPNPTSGYFVYVNKTDVIELEMSVEESIKILMSAGVVQL